MLKERLSPFGMSYCTISQYFCTPTPSISLCHLLFTFSAIQCNLLWIFLPLISLTFFTRHLTHTGFSLLKHFFLYNWHIGGVTWATGNPYLWTSMHSFSIHSESLRKKKSLFFISSMLSASANVVIGPLKGQRSLQVTSDHREPQRTEVAVCVCLKNPVWFPKDMWCF